MANKKLTSAEREELAELRAEMELCSLGDRPMSPPAARLARLIELESRAPQTGATGTDTKATAEALARRISEIATRAIGPEAEDEWFARATAIIQPALDTARADGIEAAANEIPTSWLDPLLTGPDAVLKTKGGTWGCPEVESLLRGVKDRIRALLPEKAETKEIVAL